MQLLTEIFKSYLGSDTLIFDHKMIGGGCINHGALVNTDQGPFFVKWSEHPLAMFEAEMEGLKLLRSHSDMTIPEPLMCSSMGSNSFLIMQFIQKGLSSGRFWENFGRNLGRLHKVVSKHYGLEEDNYIGSLPQLNEMRPTWVEFFIELRINPQLVRARDQGLIGKDIVGKFDDLFAQLDNLLPNEPPSLLHGDLWSGNYLIDSRGEAAVIDPAVYYGHREMELSFSKLFGGFDPKFYQSYHETYPLEAGFEDRVDIHNLYPLLVHVNLFGTSYLSGIIRTLDRFT